MSRAQARSFAKHGYILLETLIAGGIVSIALATSVTMIAAARYETSMAAKRAEASSLALSIADGLMSSADVEVVGLTPVPNHPGFKSSHEIVVTGTLASASVPALPEDSTMHLIRVTVEYPTSRGTETVKYERLRRKVP